MCFSRTALYKSTLFKVGLISPTNSLEAVLNSIRKLGTFLSKSLSIHYSSKIFTIQFYNFIPYCSCIKNNITNLVFHLVSTFGFKSFDSLLISPETFIYFTKLLAPDISLVMSSIIFSCYSSSVSKKLGLKPCIRTVLCMWA